MPLIGSRNKIETKGEDSSEVSVKAPTDDVTNSSTQQPESSKSKHRLSCTRCYRPTPRACICEALPGELITLEETEIVILQHPHELRQKNRSVPIFELCLENNNLHLCIGRRLGNETNPNILNLLQPPNIPILLYPEESNSDVQVLILSQAKVQLQQRKEEMKLKQEPSGKIVVLGLDATWKYAREMHLAKQKDNHYPSHMLQVSLQAEDFPESFRPRRFDIRTTPGGYLL
jgi:DTW domain-containing protein YfiP